MIQNGLFTAVSTVVEHSSISSILFKSTFHTIHNHFIITFSWYHIVHSFLKKKSFLDTPELLFTDKTSARNSLEYCSLLRAGSPTSHLAQLDAAGKKAFNINGISHDEAESLGLSLRHRRQVGGISVFFHLISGLAPCPPPYFASPQVSLGRMQSTSNPLLLKLPTSRTAAYFHSFFPLFPTCGSTFHTLFNLILLSRS